MSEELDEVISEFVVESYENLDQLDRDLLALEDDPDNRAVLGSVFRTIHTVKGTCGFLGYGKLEAIAHVGENLLSKLRDGVLRLTPEMADSLLALSDAVRAILAEIERTGAEGDVDYTALTDTLASLKDGSAIEALEVVEAVTEAFEVEAAEAPLESRLGELLVAHHDATEEQVTEAVSRQILGDDRKIGQILVEETGVAAATVVAALEKQGEGRSSMADSSVRVDVRLLDNLMTLVGELVLARNRVVQLVTEGQDPALVATSQRLSLITTELQESAMKTRMQPIGNVWSKFPRIVRDLAGVCNKSVRVEMEGEETELDKTIIESIKDPLTHLVRNSVDHGIESREVRTSMGKSAEGRLLLRAFHEGGQVIIEISDDGAGLNPDKIRAKAVERGLVTAEEAARLTERDLSQLIFEPGFSTAETITNVSGRGVGMDVVRTNIEKIGGSVDISSAPGEGTTFRIKIPLTLAIIPALIVTAGAERFAIPQINLLELVRLDGAEARAAIEHLHGTPVYRLRGNLLPLVHLHEQLEIEKLKDDDVINIVVLRADDRAFGLVVEGVSDSAEIVVKPLGNHFKGLTTFAGATILGDGRVALILDVMGLAQRSNVVSEARDRSLSELTDRADVEVAETTAALLFRTPDDGRMALSLALVDRLEELSPSAIERTGDSEVVQYRGDILPLLRLAAVLPERRLLARNEAEATATANDLLQVVVVRHGDHRVGLVVDQILDIVDQPNELQPAGRAGVAGTAVIADRVTEVIDLPAVLTLAGLTERSFETAGV
ncbi:MAG: histidine kinase [Actinomycetia bacterium]|nr:histidine kinase [Actinomycetes bacterium]